ncbi:class I SAM-dependent methyltransferase [Natronosporangium hydrolyticum]|uniref:Class I SAM-dependent methyltransferase n=1 Tax=Natronosporangium hydrolyticum TaxID=2811111 RepID=A0A895YPM4_9ACTN|nr:class I SAM-dependent methyltransferase [Natronosporangium hydrolyticum]QSB15908.1 class I SAM-dependent methyltransferase [Natronosporangium hydrolyticum]
MPSVEWNQRVWGEEHGWEHAGDEWRGMADHCGASYPAWKQGLVATFIEPVPTGSRVLEIAPGHGRWSGYLLSRAESLALVDIAQPCLDACRERLDGDPRVSYHLTGGSSLAPLVDQSVDFAWSFDAFVHMDWPIIQGYLYELARVLTPGGTAVIHHAGQADWALSLAPVTRRLGRGGRVLQRWAGQRRLRDSGNRSPVSARLLAQGADQAGLRVLRQTDRWGATGQFTVGKYRDCISVLRRP